MRVPIKDAVGALLMGVCLLAAFAMAIIYFIVFGKEEGCNPNPPSR